MSPISPVPKAELHSATILIVDDEQANVRLLTRILEKAGFSRVRSTTDPRQALPLFTELEPDVVCLDLRMPELDGFAVLEQLRKVVKPGDFLPVLAITGDVGPDTRHRVLSAGAKDFLEKPFASAEVVVRVSNLLTTRLLHRAALAQNEQLEHKVRARTAELELALAAAENASRAKSQFLATMSHELRTPLNAVIGFANHLKRNKSGNLQAQDLAFLERIVENGTHLLTIIQDILDLSRVEAGKVVVERTSVALHRVIAETVKQVAADGVSATVRVPVRVCVSPSLQPIVTDEQKLRRVLINLVDNAAKFTESGYVCVRTDETPDGRARRIDVVDTGIGIAEERLEAIFDRFEQADNSTQRKFGGTGLGLAISRTLCELLGYRLNVISELGAGSVFSIVLQADAPLPRSYAEAAAACVPGVIAS